MDRAAAVERVRAYYACLDEGRYERLESLLHPAFEQQRPDRDFTDRSTFVSFMREDRPMTETTHELVDVFTTTSGASTAVAVQGELRGPDGDRLFGFVDVHEFDTGRIVTLTTYTD